VRGHLFFWLLLFAAGAFVGDRYGLPAFATSAADRGFEAVEGWVGSLGGPVSGARDGLDDGETADNEAETATAEPDPAPPPATDSAANQNLRINDAGLQIIKDSEGLRLEAYNLGGQWLIGYGHARTARAGMTITEAEAERLLREDTQASEEAVRSMVTVSVNVNQFSAMVSLAYNLGAGGFSRTSVLERINSGDYQGAADAFLHHDRARINGVLQSIPHLTERREKERALFLTPV